MKKTVTYTFETATWEELRDLGIGLSVPLKHFFNNFPKYQNKPDRMNVKVEANPGAGKSWFSGAVMEGLNLKAKETPQGVVAELNGSKKLVWKKISGDDFEHRIMDKALLDWGAHKRPDTKIEFLGDNTSLDCPKRSKKGVDIYEHPFLMKDEDFVCAVSIRQDSNIEDSADYAPRVVQVTMPEIENPPRAVQKYFLDLVVQ